MTGFWKDRQQAADRSVAAAYYDQLEASMVTAILAGRNLAVSPLLGDIIEGFRYEFVQCDGIYPAAGWTTYHTSRWPVAVSLGVVGDAP